MTFYGLHHRSAVLAASLALLTACDPSLFQALGECCEAGDNPLPNLQPDARGNCVQGEPALVCARSNDRFCGPGENFCNSPIDCPAPPPPCTEAGFVFESF